MSVYMIAAVNIEDEAAFARYGVEAAASLAGHNVEMLAADDEPVLLEGTLPGRRIILFRFDTTEEMEAWYRSDAYVQAMKHRHEGATTPFFVAIKSGFHLDGG